MNKDTDNIFKKYVNKNTSKYSRVDKSDRYHWALVVFSGENSQNFNVYKNYGELDEEIASTLAEDLLDQYGADDLRNYGDKPYWEDLYPLIKDVKGNFIIGSYQVGEGYYLVKSKNSMPHVHQK